jgi:hypothetical protein
MGDVSLCTVGDCNKGASRLNLCEQHATELDLLAELETLRLDTGALRAENARLREALLPLAHALDAWPYDDPSPITELCRLNYDSGLRAKHVRAAAAALATEGGG